MSEKFIPVIGSHGFYVVGNLGTIKRVKKKITDSKGRSYIVSGKTIKQVMSNYPSVTLWVNGMPTVKKVHRIVAEAWIQNPNKKPEVNHKDGNRSNNRASNLEWVTRKENTLHAASNRLMPRGENHKNHKISDAAVKSIRAAYLSGKDQKTIGKKFGCSQSNVSQIVNNITRRS